MSDDRARFELLDAHLDGELAAEEEREVRALLEGSAEARAELADIARVRSMVRGLPEEQPPFGFYERMTSPRLAARQAARGRQRAPGFAVALAGIAAAIALIAVGLTPTADQLVPDVSSFEERHDTMMAASSEPVDDGEFDPMPEHEVDAMDAPYAAPESLPMGYERTSVYHAPDVWQLVYTDGTHVVSVFEQAGMVDWDEMPDTGNTHMVDDDKAWQSHTDDGTVVLERDGLVVVVVGSAPAEHAMTVANAIPDPPDPSLADRAADACRELTSLFGFPT